MFWTKGEESEWPVFNLNGQSLLQVIKKRSEDRMQLTKQDLLCFLDPLFPVFSPHLVYLTWKSSLPMDLL